MPYLRISGNAKVLYDYGALPSEAAFQLHHNLKELPYSRDLNVHVLVGQQ